jgi:mRNA deadenylase 3'-5' endonuclease subunit Ccr4
MNTQSVVSIFVVLELCMSLTMTNIPPNESYLPRMIGTKAPYLDPTVSTVIPFTYPDSGPGTPTITIPGPYQWADSYGTVTSDPTSQANTKVLNLVTYNILAPINGEGEKHAYAPVSVTKWTRRRDKIVDEIRKLKCDILCLQEMSAKGLKETFIPKLGALGLECCAYAPSKQADRSRGKYAHRQIGNAVFIRSEKLKVLSAKRIHLKDFTPLESCTSHNFVTDVHSRHDSMAMVQVQVKDSNEILIICNAHFYWNPNRADIKAIQAYAAVEAIHRFCIMW